jgi:4a-hydroxytetrahydrobiopterin dehydratase
MAATPLSEAEIAQSLTTVPQWERQGAEIMRTYAFPSYLAGIEFVTRVASLAEAANHHPDIHVGWRKVTLRLSTHSAHALTQKDFDLARQVDALVS